MGIITKDPNGQIEYKDVSSLVGANLGTKSEACPFPAPSSDNKDKVIIDGVWHLKNNGLEVTEDMIEFLDESKRALGPVRVWALDLGSGTGRNTAELVRRFMIVRAIDKAKKCGKGIEDRVNAMLEMQQRSRHYGNGYLGFEHADAIDYLRNPKEGPYNIVIACGLIHFLPIEAQEEFAELITSPKILKKEGALFIQYRNDMLSDEHMRSLYIKRLEPRKVIFQRVKIKVAEGEKIIDIVHATNIIALPVN